MHSKCFQYEGTLPCETADASLSEADLAEGLGRMNHSVHLRRSYTAGVLWLALLLGLATRLQAKSDSAPDWVHAAAVQTLPSYPSETDAVVLMDDITYTVAPNGQAVQHERRVVKILRPQGRNECVVHINFDKDTKILSLSAWSIAADEHEYAIKDKDFIDIGLAGGGVEFDDVKYRTAGAAPGCDPGAIVAYEVEQRARPYITETTWRFQGSIPRLNQGFTLDLPAGYSYGAVWAHHAPVQPTSTDAQHLRWEMKDVPGINLAQVFLAPSSSSLAGRMTIHYAGSGIANATDGTWKSIGEWYSQLSKDRLTATPEIGAKAAELTAGKTDFYDKSEAIGEFVQKQVRYFAVELGIGGLQPHAAGDIFHNRYGDCKDKATLLASMLSTVGIHSTLVMVHTERGVVDRDAPSIVGNHMIAAIEIPAGYDSPKLHSVVKTSSGRRYLIFDPTWEKTPFGQLEYNLQGGIGLLVEGGESQAIELPVMDPALNKLHRSGSFQLGADGVLKGTVVERRFGDLSVSRREIYTRADAKQQSAYLNQILARDFTVFTASDVKVENVDALNRELTMSYALNVDHYAKSVGTLLMVRPRVLGSLGYALDHKKRTVAINLEQTMQADDDYTIELPAGYAVDEIPDPVKIDVGFAAYQSSFEVHDNKLHYTCSFQVRQLTLAADRYADVQKLASAISDDESSSTVLKKQ